MTIGDGLNLAVSPCGNDGDDAPCVRSATMKSASCPLSAAAPEVWLGLEPPAVASGPFSHFKVEDQV